MRRARICLLLDAGTVPDRGLVDGVEVTELRHAVSREDPRVERVHEVAVVASLLPVVAEELVARPLR